MLSKLPFVLRIEHKWATIDPISTESILVLYLTPFYIHTMSSQQNMLGASALQYIQIVHLYSLIMAFDVGIAIVAMSA